MSLLVALRSYVKYKGFHCWMIAEQSVEIPAEPSPATEPNKKVSSVCYTLGPCWESLYRPIRPLPGTHFYWSSWQYVMPPRKLGAWESQEAGSCPLMLDMPALPTAPPPDDIEKLSPKFSPLGCIWEVQCRSSLCSDPYKLQGEFYH